jgi:ABC-type multidrug transport system fused ATPase/permease subunit
MGAFYLGIHEFVGGRAEKYGRELAEVGPRMLKMSTEVFGAIKEIKARSLEPVFKEFFTPLRQRHVTANLRQHVLSNVPPAMVEILAFGGILVIALFLIASSDNYQSLVPTLGLYVLAIRRLLPSAQGIFQSLAQMRFHRPSLKIICPDLEAMEIGDSDSIPRGHPLELRSKLELVGLEYSYPDTEPKVLDGITMEIEAGQCVGIVGGSGAGKTTMVDLVTGLLEPTGGSVVIDGKPLDSSCVSNWQHGLGYVPQSIFLLDDTVVKNIAFGVPEQEIDMDRVREVSQLAQIGRFIEQELPEGYQTMVGERGVRLSGGQQQRLGIARALYHQPTMLVLDEATSALDGITEEQLLNELKTLTGHVTIIMVAHRLTTLKDCDVVFLLDCGRLVAQGTHARLLADCPMYARMARQSVEAVNKGEQAGLVS